MTDKRKMIVEMIKKYETPVVIYGSGKFAVSVADFLLKHGIEILGFWDDERYYHAGRMITIACNTYATMDDYGYMDIKVPHTLLLGVIDFGLLEEIEKKANKYCKYVEYLDVYPSHIMEEDFLADNKRELEKLYRELADDESKTVMREYIIARYSGDVAGLCKINHGRYTYDWDLLNLCYDDIIIDAGAYNGDTIEEVNDFLSGNLCEVIAFEPDRLNFERLKEKFGTSKRIRCINAGVWKESTTLCFETSGTLGASLKEDALEKVEVVSIDSYLEENDGTVTLIKMDIEGSELEALKGSRETIKARMPKMAICIYHRNKDLIEIWKFINEITKNSIGRYQLYLRQHSNSVEETVLYAIPVK